MKRKILRHFVLQEFEDHSWAIREFVDGSIWPATYKPTDRETLSRLAQLLTTGPIAPQLDPESICIGDFNDPET